LFAYENSIDNLENEDGSLQTFITNEFVSKLKVNVTMKLKESKFIEKNIFNLSEEENEIKDFKFINIAIDKPKNIEEDNPLLTSLKNFKISKLDEEWIEKSDIITYVYCLVSIDIPIWPVQSKVEDFALGEQKGNLIKDFCKIFCTADKWHDIKIEDLRNMVLKAYKIEINE
jgi:hypothetical protein